MLDTRLLDAERKRLEANKAAFDAQLRFATLTVERQSELSDRGFASQAALDEALSRSQELTSRIAEIDAALTSNAVQRAKSSIYAPFTGRVTERFVDGGESLSPGQPLVEIVEDAAPQLRVGLPIEVGEGHLAKASAIVAGIPYEVSLITLRPDIDPITRTRTALFGGKDAADMAVGQTARLTLHDEVASEGFWVSVTSLKEGLRGQWTLLVVDADNVVRSATVQPLHTNGDDVFVQGAFPEGVRLIDSGPQRVSVGQTVNPLPVF